MVTDSVSYIERGMNLDSEVRDDEISTGIINFYNGRSVFITGAAGFLGTVLLESLLRCCPGLENIYILIREKQNLSLDERKEKILQKKIFTKLRNTNAEVFKKVRLVGGDIIKGDLGIKADMMLELQEKVSVVMHCAASISFFRSFRQMVFSNVIGTDNVLKFCRKLSQLVAFIHCSTAFSNCNQKNTIEEKVYELEVDAKEFIDAAKAGDDAKLEQLVSRCKPSWPNNYTLTKALAEDLISRDAKYLPCAIVRPSIIIQSWKGALPGYAETGGGLIDLSIGVGKGFIRVLYLKKNNVIDVVPVDFVTNTLITTSWYISRKRVKSYPLVVNCTLSHTLALTWGEIVDILCKINEDNPLPMMYQSLYLVVRSHRITYWMSSLINHYAPAIFIDTVLLIIGKKPILTSLYRSYDRLANQLTYFIDREWKFDYDNLKMLISAMSSEDSEVFPMNLDNNFDKCEWMRSVVTGSDFYDWKLDKRSFEERITISQKRYMVTTFIKWVVVIALLAAFGVLIMKTFSLF